MPSYTITCRGGLLSKSGLKPVGSTVEMSEADALSLPPGSVAIVAKAEAPKPTPKSEPKGSKDSK